MNKRTHSKGFVIGSVIGIIFLIAIIVCIIWLCHCITLAFQDDYKDKYTLSDPDNTLMTTVVKSAIFGSEFEITDKQLNTYIDEKLNKQNSSNDYSLEKMAIYFHKDLPSELYARIKLYGYTFGFYSNVNLSLNTETQTLTVKLSNAKLGNLSISDNILSFVLSKAVIGNDYIKSEGTEISIRFVYEFEISDSIISLYCEELTPNNGYAVCRTNSLTEEAIAALSGYINSSKGQEIFRDFWNSIDLDKIKDYINFDKIKDYIDFDKIKDNIKDNVSSWWDNISRRSN